MSFSNDLCYSNAIRGRRRRKDRNWKKKKKSLRGVCPSGVIVCGFLESIPVDFVEFIEKIDKVVDHAGASDHVALVQDFTCDPI
jgi:hypothetical protein